jgi:hypothetical protein
LKFIPLNASGTIYVTLGLENRTEFQYLNSNAWGAAARVKHFETPGMGVY